jgi:lipopolysaccharide/colanic/teichoic acid biosynthesis glycosyltransferase
LSELGEQVAPLTSVSIDPVGVAIDSARTQTVGVAIDSGRTQTVGVAIEPGRMQTVTATIEPARTQTRLAERVFDLVITIVLLPLVAIAAALIALAIYVDSPGPVLFRSRRVGRRGDPFEMLKFRKMRRDAPSDRVTLDDDERFTPIGRFLAATRLDELPQVINVLRGEMRLVGPRPELAYFVDQYPEQYAEILSITPGITGDAQLQFVNERRLLDGPDPENVYSEHLLPAKIEIDIEYTRSHSLPGDLAILARTALLPFAMLRTRARESGAVRVWGPVAGAAVLLGVLFVLFSSQLA